MRSESYVRRNCWSRFGRRTVLAFPLVAVLIMAMPFFSSAEENSAIPSSGTLTVQYKDETELYNAGISLKIDLYKVASVSIQDGSTASYVPTSVFEGIDINGATGSGEWRSLAQDAAKRVLDPNIGKNQKTPDKSDIALESRTELDIGIYLLVARSGTEDYVTVTGEGDIVTKASAGGETYLFSPVLVSVPGWDSTSAVWQYNVEVYLKAEQDEQFGLLKIVKTLQGSDAGIGPVTFVFDIEAVLDGRKVYSNVVSMVFQKAGVEELLIEKLPAGATVTVTEVYSGARCSLVTADTQTAVIELDTTASVTFTNAFDDRRNSGQSITNHFSHGADGWKLDQLIDKSQG